MGKRGVTLPREATRCDGADGALMVAGLVVLHIIEHPGRWVLSSADWPGRDLEIDVGAKEPALQCLGRAVPPQFGTLP
jgi:hypothetical protein